jgi:hypothetical protein
VETTTRVRQAKLKPECADRYPTLPVGMWTSALGLAALVALFPRERPEPSSESERDRPLSDQDFEFRGGLPTGGATGFPECPPMSRPLTT